MSPAVDIPQPGDAKPRSPMGNVGGRNQGSSHWRYALEPRQRAALLGLAHDIRRSLDELGGTEHRTQPVAYGKWVARNWRFGCLLRWTGGPDHHIRRPRLSTLRRVEQRLQLEPGTAEHWANAWPDAIAPEANDGHRAD